MKTLFRISVLMLTLIMGVLQARAQTIRVDGEGYLRLVLNGQVVYSRSVKVARINGRLGAEGGAVFLPAIECPSAPSSLKIDLNGTVWCSGQAIGKLVLAQFKTSLPVADGTYLVSSTRPDLTDPGEGTAGVIRFGNPGQPSPKPVSTQSQPKPATQPKFKIQPTGAAPTPTGLIIKVRAASQVSTDRFTLGQIADITGDPLLVKVAQDVIVGDTPPIGIDRLLDVARLKGQARQAGFDPTKLNLEVPAGAKVYRECQTIPGETLIQTAIDAANAILGPNGTLRSSGPTMPLRVTKGTLELVCNSVNDMQGQVRCVVDIYVDGRKINAATVLLTRENARQKLMIGSTVTVRCLVGAMVVETTGKVTRVGAKATDPVEVKTTDGATLTGLVNSRGEVEVTE